MQLIHYPATGQDKSGTSLVPHQKGVHPEKGTPQPTHQRNKYRSRSGPPPTNHNTNPFVPPRFTTVTTRQLKALLSQLQRFEAQDPKVPKWAF